MSKENYKNYFNGGCSTCTFAERDERGRYIGSCSGFSNCSYEEYKGETDITEEEKDQKIADLEAKLAESEKAIKYLKGIKRYDIGEMLTENAKLKQQLAEKEKEIKKWKTKWCDSENNSLRLYEQNQIKDQDKISFAVEQLTLFKNTFLNRTNNLYIVNMEDIWADLDNQIKQLKEGK